MRPLFQPIFQFDLMTFDLDMWSLTTSTSEGSQVSSMTQLWLNSLKVCVECGAKCSPAYTITDKHQWTLAIPIHVTFISRQHKSPNIQKKKKKEKEKKKTHEYTKKKKSLTVYLYDLNTSFTGNAASGSSLANENTNVKTKSSSKGTRTYFHNWQSIPAYITNDLLTQNKWCSTTLKLALIKAKKKYKFGSDSAPQGLRNVFWSGGVKKVRTLKTHTFA